MCLVLCVQTLPTEQQNHLSRTPAMKILLASAAGWIAFYLADQALYDGQHVAVAARFAGSIASGFASR
jgi:hypothetical protein